MDEKFQVVYVGRGGNTYVIPQSFDSAENARRYLDEVIIGPGLVIRITDADEIFPVET